MKEMQRVLNKMPKKKVELGKIQDVVNDVESTFTAINDRLKLIENALGETLEASDFIVQMQNRTENDLKQLEDAISTLTDLGVDIPDNLLNAQMKAFLIMDYKAQELFNMLNSAWDKLEI